MSLEDDLVDQFRTALSLNREEMQTCMNRANITEGELSYLRVILIILSISNNTMPFQTILCHCQSN